MFTRLKQKVAEKVGVVKDSEVTYISPELEKRAKYISNWESREKTFLSNLEKLMGALTNQKVRVHLIEHFSTFPDNEKNKIQAKAFELSSHMFCKLEQEKNSLPYVMKLLQDRKTALPLLNTKDVQKEVKHMKKLRLDRDAAARDAAKKQNVNNPAKRCVMERCDREFNAQLDNVTKLLSKIEEMEQRQVEVYVQIFRAISEAYNYTGKRLTPPTPEEIKELAKKSCKPDKSLQPNAANFVSFYSTPDKPATSPFAQKTMQLAKAPATKPAPAPASALVPAPAAVPVAQRPGAKPTAQPASTMQPVASTVQPVSYSQATQPMSSCMQESEPSGCSTMGQPRYSAERDASEGSGKRRNRKRKNDEESDRSPKARSKPSRREREDSSRSGKEKERKKKKDDDSDKSPKARSRPSRKSREPEESSRSGKEKEKKKKREDRSRRDDESDGRKARNKKSKKEDDSECSGKEKEKKKKKRDNDSDKSTPRDKEKKKKKDDDSDRSPKAKKKSKKDDDESGDRKAKKKSKKDDDESGDRKKRNKKSKKEDDSDASAKPRNKKSKKEDESSKKEKKKRREDDSGSAPRDRKKKSKKKKDASESQKSDKSPRRKKDD